jgi:hypothetical protein
MHASLAQTRLWIVVLVVVLATGCAQTAHFQVWQPAELDVAGIHRLAILEFRGPGQMAQPARSELVARLWDSGFYNIVDPTELNIAVQTGGVNADGKPDIGVAIDAGRRMGLDAILIGEVVRYRADEGGHRDHRTLVENADPDHPYDRNGESGGVAVHRHHDILREREVSVALALELVDVHNGQTRARRQSSFRADSEIHNGQGYLPSKDAASSELITRWAREMTDLLTPHLIRYDVQLATPRLTLAGNELGRGNKRAIEGNWEQAARHWQTVLETDPKNYAAFYNLGLAYAAQFDYSHAAQLLQDANRIHPNSTYLETLSRIQRHEQTYLMAMSQKREGEVLASRAPAGNSQ